ncbi:MAG: hypothetical protein OJF58_000226 [Enhydrobacter sp.]|nr:MAG: hypothetical protein OJF58_000226 [Enhydrobacter sp.]
MSIGARGKDPSPTLGMTRSSGPTASEAKPRDLSDAVRVT